jgi:GT2 family glycosyltransferase
VDARPDAGSDRVDCAVVIVTYNSADHLPGLLESLPAASAGCTTRTIVIDNGSTDDTVAIARATEGVTCIESGANLGYAGGINAGRAAAGSRRSTLVLNPDLRVHPGALAELLRALDEPGTGAAVARLVDNDGQTLWSQRRDPTLGRAVGDALFGEVVRHRPAWSGETVDDPAAYEDRHEVDWATGAAILVSEDCERAVGDWDESYFMYSEEVDYALRIRSAGYRILYVPGAVASHAEGGSGRSDALVALLALNRVRCYAAHHGRLASAAYRVVLGLHEASRCWSAARRHSALVVLGLAAPPSFPGAEPVAPVPW